MNKSTTITKKGQVTIPVAIRRKLELSAGDSVIFQVSSKGRAVLKKNDWKIRFRKLQKQVADHLKKHRIPPVSDEKLDQLINESAQAAALEHANQFLKK